MLKDLRLHIGKRIIKTSVSAAVAMLIAHSLELEFPSLAVVAAIIILQPTFHETIQYATNRMIGTLIGCALGLLSIYIIKINVAFDVFFGTLILLVLTSTFSIVDAGVLGIIAFVSIVTDPDATIITVNNRIFNTAIGAFTSIAMNLIFPVQPIEKKSLVISFRILKLDTKLLCESLKTILGTSKLSEDDLSEINNEIIKEFNLAYKFKMLMKQEQKFATNNTEYEIFNDRYETMWDIHSSILQIHNTTELTEIEISETIKQRIAEVAAILDEMLDQKSIMPTELVEKLTSSIEKMEEDIASDFDSGYYDEVYNEGGILMILVKNLKRFSETIGVYTP